MIAGLLLLVVVGMAVYGASSRVDARRRGVTASGGDLRDRVVRFFRLTLLFAAVVLVSEGVAGLIAEIVPRAGEVTRDPATLARALSFSIVGVPVLAGLALWQRGTLGREPDEARTSGWHAYLTVTLGLSLLLTVSAATSVATWALGAAEDQGSALGRLVSWSAVWLVHWRLARRADAGAEADLEAPLHLLFGSAVGLVLTAGGLDRLIGTSLERAYERAWLTTAVADGTDPLVRALVLLGVGAGVWWWYWLRHAERCPRSPGRDAYVLLGGVLGGLIAAVVGAAQLLYAVLDWIFGDPEATTAAANFTGTPGAAALGVVGLLVWLYHRGIVARQHDGTRTDIDRVYSYLGAAVGLVITAVATTIAVAALLEALTTSDSLTRSGVADTVVLAVTLLAVGAPVWAAFWFRAQRFAGTDDERASLPRRVYLLVVLGVSAVVALVALVLLLIRFFEDLTRGDVGSETWYALRIPAGLVLSMGALAGYHATVFRTDHRATASAPVAPAPDTTPGPIPVAVAGAGAGIAADLGRLGEVFLVSSAADADGLADGLHERLHVRVRDWHLAAPTTPAAPARVPAAGPTLEEVAGAIERGAAANPEATRMIVVLEADGSPRLFPLLPD